MNSPQWRLAIYCLLIGSALAGASGRIMSITARDQQTPFLSANDRSRWSTVVALVDDGTYVIDRFQANGSWQTIDKVRHSDRDGVPHFYSSKPPLLPTIAAGGYWLIQRVTGLRLEEHPFILGRALIWLTNIPALTVYLVVLAYLVERWGQTDWGRVFVVTAGCWATFLTTFAVTFNNHLPAAVCVMVTLYCLWRIRDGSDTRWVWILAGCSSAFAVACELPALAFFCLIVGWLGWHQLRNLVFYFLPAALLIAVAFFVTNFIAHGDWRVAYSHREWYDYPGSYWTGARSGPDRGEPSQLVYLFHVLIGHHGLFTLTPIWCISAWGIRLGLRSQEDILLRWISAVTLTLAIVCVGFYVTRPEIDRNYGGVTCGLRWLFWLTPLALVSMIRGVDVLASSSRSRLVCAIFLIISTFSAAYGWPNPWVNPWPYSYGVAQGWIAK
ncbi:MAG: hypothetical protein O2931_03410 [Planctomycetota bacterium]|nr:hypothetical protein [Planctomycetota bacterium]MDA1177824.1 hypothetical protein [Planctomycetota bacterium]